MEDWGLSTAACTVNFSSVTSGFQLTDDDDDDDAQPTEWLKFTQKAVQVRV